MFVPQRVVALALPALLSAGVPLFPLDVVGPSADRVYQRGADGLADIPISLENAPPGASGFTVRIDGDGFSLAGGAPLIEGGAPVTLAGVPVGGPYTITVTTLSGDGDPGETAVVEGILVGDLWVLAGQSNMEGSASLRDLEEPSPMVKLFSLGDEWEVARDPLSRPWQAIDPVHWRTSAASAPISDAIRDAFEEADIPITELEPRKRPIPPAARRLLEENGVAFSDHLELMRPDPAEAARAEAFRVRGAGLGVAFGKELYKLTGVPVGLIINANGGTSQLQWSPELGDHGGESLYGSLMRRIRSQGGRIAGVAWSQGENERWSAGEAAIFGERLRTFVEAVRAEVGNPELPFIYMQAGRLFQSPAETYDNWKQVQFAQYAFEDELPGVRMVPILEGTLSDALHLDAASLRRVGRQMARQAATLQGVADVGRGPRLSNVTIASPDRRQLRLHFSHVNGVLACHTAVSPFRLFDEGDRRLVVDGIEVDPENPAAILLTLPEPAPPIIHVDHGWGFNPVTGIVDSSDMSIPAFPLKEFRLYDPDEP